MKRIIMAALSMSMFLGTFYTPNQSTSKPELVQSVEETIEKIQDGGELAQQEFVPNSLIVKYRHRGLTTRKAKPTFSRALPIASIQEIDMPQSNSLRRGLFSFGTTRYYALNLTTGSDMETAMLLLSKEASVEFVEPNFVRRTSTQGDMDIINTDDPMLNRQWMNQAINVNDARTFLAEKGLNPGGSKDVVVAVIDTGVDHRHEDLAPNMWVNSGEIPGNGIDDDKNGYIDDIHGVSTLGTTFQHSGDSSDVHGHGTHVAGIIAAKGNNGLGIRGVADNVRIMAIRAGQQSGAFNVLDIVDGINYAYMMKADVINMSYGGYFSSQLEKEALEFAFSEAALIGAAGNDSYTNRPHPLGKNFYPASYTFVVGVMATAPGRSFSFFTNVDFEPYDTQEYEVMAPGSGILSTIPNNKYASWNGTSMAAPVVSGVAALLRSYFTDRMSYSNRFIMSQIIGTGNEVWIPGGLRDLISPKWENYTEVDAYKALTTNPIPFLTVYSSYVWDKVSLNPEKNDGDGVIDAGETIQLAITIRNQWGIASDTIVSINTETPAGANYDIVNITQDTVNYGRIGTFGTKDNGFIYDDNEEIIGIENPFTFTIVDNAPNDIFLKFNVIITAKNGFDPDDETLYEYERSVVHKVRNGRELPAVITEDMTLTKYTYWIIPASTMISSGVTVTVEPGTQIQFWGGDPEDPYALKPIAYLQVEGKFIVNGTEDEPVVMMPSDRNLAHSVNIYRRGEGYVELTHAKITNPLIDADLIDFVHFNQSYGFMLYRVVDTSNPFITNNIIRDYHASPDIKADFISNSIFKGLGGRYAPAVVSGRLYHNLFDSNFLKLRVGEYTTVNNVFLNNYRFYQSDFFDSFQGIQTSFMEFSSSYSNLKPQIDSLKYNPETGTTYFLVQAYTWQQEAVSLFSKEISGNLVSINSVEENEFIKTNYPNQEVVLGLEYNGDQFSWSSNEPISFVESKAKFIDPFSYELIGKEPNVYQSFVSKNGEWSISDNYFDKSFFLIEVPGEVYLSDIQLITNTINLSTNSDPYNLQVDLTPTTFNIENLVVVAEDTSIVLINSSNQMIGLKEGTSLVSVYSKDQTLVKTFRVNVSQPIELLNFTITAESNIVPIGSSLNLKVDLEPIDTTKNALEWTTSDSSIATVNHLGKVTTHKSGLVTITATSKNNITKSIEIEVVLPVSSIDIVKDSIELDIQGVGLNIDIDFYPNTATNKEIIWELSNPNVVEVSENGTIKPIGLGTVYLRATAKGTSHKNDIFDQIFISVVKSENYGLKTVFAGMIADYSLGVMDNGDLWIWGGLLNSPIKLGYSGFSSFAQDVNSNYSNSRLFLGKNGLVYFADSNKLIDSIWPGINFSFNEVFTLIEGFNNVKKVAQNNRSYYVLLNNGSLYSWGDNSRGQLGDGTKVYRESPVRVFGVNNVIDINTTGDPWSHNAVRILTSNGDLFGFGNNITSIPTKYAIGVDQILNFYHYRKGDKIFKKTTTYENSTIDSLQFNIGFIPTALINHGHQGIDAFYTDSAGLLYRNGIVIKNYTNFISFFTTQPNYIEQIHTVFGITSEGKLYAWMDNRYGQHANFTLDYSELPQRVPLGLEKNQSPLQITNQSLSNLSNNVNIANNFIFSFNYAIRRSTNYALLHLKNANNDLVNISLSIRLNQLIINPEAPLMRNQTYTLIIPERAVVDDFDSPNQLLSIIFTTTKEVALENESIVDIPTELEPITNSYIEIDELKNQMNDFINGGGELGLSSNFAYNAILNNLKNPSTDYWLKFVAPVGNRTFALGYNYWGTNSENLITRQIIDFNNYQGLGDVLHSPILSVPKESTYPFVYDYYFSNELEDRTDIVGLESSTLHLVFNRDMNTTVQPDVFFGPAEPFTDYRITGEWISPREWIATPRITLLTGDGNQYLRVANALAEGTKRLINGDDKARMMFRIITISGESMSLQATGAEGRVILNWMQDDVSNELLAGYNIYRSTNLTTNFTRVNQYVVIENLFEDFTALPGVTYYYKFTVVKTDFVESIFSNIAAASSFDTIKPTLTHSPITNAFSGQDVTFVAFATDNIAIQEVNIHLKQDEDDDFTSFPMTKITSSERFTYVLKANLITNPLIYYYITAEDDLSTVTSGTDITPHIIIVVDSPTISSVSPTTGSVKGGTTITISGNNFKTGARVFFGSFEGLNVVVESSSVIRLTTPIGFPSPVNVRVVNPFGGEATLVNGYTFIADTALVSIPFVSANLGQEIFVPVKLSNVDAFIAGDFEINYDHNVLTYLGFTKGNFATNFPMFVNKPTNGTLLISIAGSLSVSGTGDVMFLRFTVTSTRFDTSNLTIKTAELNGGNLDVVINNGVVSYEPVIAFSGSVYYFFDNKVVENVTVMVESESDVVIAKTNADGGYTIGSLTKGDYVVKFTKTETEGAITAFDAALVLQRNVGLITLTAGQNVVADVDNNGRINALDASYILQYAAGFVTLPFNGRSSVWTFSTNNVEFSEVYEDKSLNVTAYLIGDVSGNFAQATTNQLDIQQALRVGAISRSGSNIVVSMDMLTNQVNLLSMQFQLQYPSNLKVSSIRFADDLIDAAKVVNLNQHGFIQVAIANTVNFSSLQAFMTVEFIEMTQTNQGLDFFILQAKFNESNKVNLVNNGIQDSLLMDLNGDNVINIDDVLLLIENTSDTSSLNLAFDYNHDGVVDIYDLLYLNSIASA